MHTSASYVQDCGGHTLIAQPCTYRRLQPVASDCGDGGDEAGQCKEQPRELYKQSPEFCGRQRQSATVPIRARMRDFDLGLVMPFTMWHHHHATVE